MKLLKYELKIKLKGLILWSLGILLLFLSGSMEFEGIANANSESINVVLNYYPKIVLALMGITESIDFSVLDGYTWVLGYFGTLIGAFYAINLGNSIVNREFIDKTFEFLFTKPKKRGYILGIKILSGFICLTGFSIITFLGSVLIMNPVDKNINITNLMFLSCLGTFFTSILFYAISIFVSTLFKKRALNTKILNCFFLITFILGGVYDVIKNGEIIRYFSPLRYFLYDDALKGHLNIIFIIITIILNSILLLFSYKNFEKRDLTEI